MQLALFEELESLQRQELTAPASSTRAQAKPKITSNFDLTERIDDEVLQVLKYSGIEGSSLFLPAELDRSLYLEVDDLLKRIRGKWSSWSKGHVFPFDEDVLAPLISSMITTGRQPAKNALAYFPTPTPVLDDLVSFDVAERLDWYEGYGAALDISPPRILEPSAGTGAIADYVRNRWPSAILECVEIDEINVQILMSKGHNVTHCDFTDWHPAHDYDVILMNPPFSVAGDSQAYMAHIEKAFTHLSPGGLLHAIAPPGFTWHSDGRSRKFLNFVAFHGGWWDIDAGAFKEYGTMTRTMGIHMQYLPWADAKRCKPYYGSPSYDMWLLQLHLDNWSEYHRFECQMANIAHAGGLPLNLVGLPADEKTLNRWRKWIRRGAHHANQMRDGFDWNNIDIDELISDAIANFSLA